MIERIRYMLLMRRLRGEIVRTLCTDDRHAKALEKPQTVVPNACKACGSIV
jgi:hypothetical protein